MNTYVLLYGGGKAGSTPQEQEKIMKVWEAWFGTLGGALVDGGKPFGPAKTVSSSGVRDGAGNNPSNGYGIIKANDLTAAANLAKGCPIVADGGQVYVFEAVAM